MNNNDLSTLKIQEDDKPIRVVSDGYDLELDDENNQMQGAVSVNSSVMFESELDDATGVLIVSPRQETD